mgnify:CR=1 FL=1
MQRKNQSSRNRIRVRIRKKISGTSSMPRIAVFRSNSEIYVQAIDDTAAHTLAAASSHHMKSLSGTKTEKAKQVGAAIAKQLIDKGINTVVFDRGGYLYHGRVKSLAEGAREGGLKF